MVAVNPAVSIITISVSGLSNLIKRQRLTDWRKGKERKRKERKRKEKKHLTYTVYRRYT